MRLRSLRATGWRNLEPLRLEFDPAARLHVFHGDNGQGKTNVLEAIYVGSSRVDLQACKLEYSIVSPK